jgi:hypothetical protein
MTRRQPPTTESLARARWTLVLEQLEHEVSRFDALSERLAALTADPPPRPKLELVRPEDDDGE